MSYIWETVEFEEIMHAALINDLGQSHGDERFGHYTDARAKLLQNILEEIKVMEPALTDHGPKHVKNVLINIHELLGSNIGIWDKENKQISNGFLNGMELYILGLSALFHDVGNVFNRKEHQKQIGPIYDLARHSSNGNQDHEEKQIILEICRAHCGITVNGDKDTLKYVTDHSKLEHQQIRPNLLAPVLRFADELAEGQQRTSQFMINNHKYSPESIPYHQYAFCSSVDIDSHHNRICLKYHISLCLNKDEKSLDNASTICIEDLVDFLTFIYHRIEKLNQERQYAKHYCSLLNNFKETNASFNFWYKDQPIPLDLPAIILSDLVIPGDRQKSITEHNNKYNPINLSRNLSEAIANMDTCEG